MSIDLRLGRWQDALADIADGSVRLILTSPPYDNARTYEDTCEPVDFDELAAFGLRVLCPGGVFAMVLDGAVNEGRQSTTPYDVSTAWASGLPHRLVRKMAAGEAFSSEDVAFLTAPRAPPEWRLLQVLAYGRRGAPGEYKGRFRRDHEPLIVMVKDGAPHVCEKGRIATATKKDLRRSAGIASSRERDGRQRVFGVHPDGAPRTIQNISHRGSFWDYGMVGHGHDPSADTGHPATFAEAFALDAVNVWSNPGDLVVDPFAGSCTVGKACKTLGRRFIGAERVPKYHEIGLRRIGDRAACERAAQAAADAVGQRTLF